MRRTALVLFRFSLICLAGVQAVSASALMMQDQNPPPDQGQYQDQNQYPDQNQNPDQGQGDDAYQAFSPEQLDNLLSPIALYPDPLLAQVLVAATFPDQVEEAARWVRGNGQAGVDDQNWDVSVRAVAHYPTVIQMMADKTDWTTSLGQAYVNQSTDVESSVQRLRHMARNAGNLVTTPQQEVLVNNDYIAIDPVQPQVIYVPVYDPAICYYRRPYFGPAISFGVGFPIGAWLNLDFRWGYRGPRGGVFYTGWQPWGGWNGGWMVRSRPVVHVTNVYVNNRFTNVYVNRTVINRHVNVENVNRYNYVHRNVTYNNIQRNNVRINNVNNVRVNNNRVPPNRVNQHVNNQVLNRNIDSNSRYNDFRGRDNNNARYNNRPQEGNRPPEGQRPTNTSQPRTTFQGRPATTTVPQNRPNFQNQGQNQGQRSPQSNMQRAPQTQAPHTFGRSEGSFDSRASSQRGQASRAQVNRPQENRSAPAARPAPAQRAPSHAAPAQHAPNRSVPAPHGGGGGKKP